MKLAEFRYITHFLYDNNNYRYHYMFYTCVKLPWVHTALQNTMHKFLHVVDMFK